MTGRFAALLAMVCAIAAPTICESPTHQARSTTLHSPARQFIDTQSDNLANTLGTAPRPSSDDQKQPSATGQVISQRKHDLPAQYDLDLPQITIAFGTAQLDQLIADGSVILPLPGLEPIQLNLVKHNQRHGIDQISAEHASLVSTVTRRGDKFFATVATHTGSYRIEGGLQSSFVYPHRELAMRTIYQTTDFRHAL